MGHRKWDSAPMFGQMQAKNTYSLGYKHHLYSNAMYSRTLVHVHEDKIIYESTNLVIDEVAFTFE